MTLQHDDNEMRFTQDEYDQFILSEHAKARKLVMRLISYAIVLMLLGMIGATCYLIAVGTVPFLGGFICTCAFIFAGAATIHSDQNRRV